MTANPADAVREALDGLENNSANGLPAYFADVKTVRDHIANLEARLAALAGAAPVAWELSSATVGRLIITKASEAEACRKEPSYTVRPLIYADQPPHAPAKAREVTDEMVQSGIDAFNDTYEAEFFSTGRISDNKAQAIRAVLEAALATFAEGAE